MSGTDTDGLENLFLYKVERRRCGFDEYSAFVVAAFSAEHSLKVCNDHGWGEAGPQRRVDITAKIVGLVGLRTTREPGYVVLGAFCNG